MSKLYSDFSESIRSRMSGSVTASVLLLPIIVTCYTLLTNVSLLHPLTWITNSFATLLTLSWWLNALTLSAIVVAVSVVSWKHFSVSPVVRTTRLSCVCWWVHPERLVHAVGHGVAGAVTAWLLSSSSQHRYSGIVHICDNNSGALCMNEYHVFVVCYGFFVGVVYGVQFFRDQRNLIVFPSIQQPRYFRVKNACLPTLKSSCGHVIREVRYFYLLYYILGGVVRQWICGSLSLQYSAVRLDTLYGLMDVGLLWYTVLTGLCIRLCWISAVVLYRIFITMPYHFCVETTIEGRTSLVEAMNSTRPLLAHHGFSCLHQVAQFSPDDRWRIFSLSQPGGHPHNWTGVLTECVRVLTDLTQRINRYVDDSPIMMKTDQQNDLYRGQQTDLYKDGATVRHRTWVGENGRYQPELIPDVHDDDAAMKLAPITLLDKIFLDIQKKPFVAFFLSPLPELLSKQLFSSCQIQIWALEGLSMLVAASLKEDEFGVVQKQVPEIVITVLALQEAVDRHAKLGLNGRGRCPGGRGKDADSALRSNLRLSLKTAMYRITETFGCHMRDFNIPYEYKRRLDSYLDYKE